MNILVYGGSASGKSAYAENEARRFSKQDGDLIYIATMLPSGVEAKQRIARHRDMRAGKGCMT